MPKKRNLTTGDVEEIYLMPPATQKLWRANGNFKRGHDYTLHGRTISYPSTRLEKHPLLRQYTADKKAAS